MGMLDRFIVIRDSVNTDVFMNGASPESLWDPDFDDSLASDDSVEAADIFATAMENNYQGRQRGSQMPFWMERFKKK